MNEERIVKLLEEIRDNNAAYYKQIISQNEAYVLETKRSIGLQEDAIENQKRAMENQSVAIQVSNKAQKTARFYLVFIIPLVLLLLVLSLMVSK